MTCKNCDRANCPTLILPLFGEWQRRAAARQDCVDHTVNWRDRALAAEAKLSTMVYELQAARDVCNADWLGLLTEQPNFGDNGTHTWADLLADLFNLTAHDDAQTLYLRIVEMMGEVQGVKAKLEQLQETVEKAIASARGFVNHGCWECDGGDDALDEVERVIGDALCRATVANGVQCVGGCEVVE